MSERQSKSVQDRHERMLNEIVKRPGNEYCADCGGKNPRWASYSLGVFLCIRCAGIHRKMGTHISKVKSITMDQWNSDQINMMRNSGGNDVVNSKINPNPGNHPRPLATDDEHAMEKYIRAKWEKRAFLNDNNSVRMSPKTIPAMTRLQTLPKRSSSVPVISNINPLPNGLNKLREMGFRDEVKNRQILAQTQGNIEAAIEILSRSTPTLFSPPQPQHQQTDDQKLDALARLGFMDRNSNMDALRRAGGNIEIAMTILNETKTILHQQRDFAGQEPLRSNSVPALLHSQPLLIDVDTTPTVTQHNPFATMPQSTNNPFSTNNTIFSQQSTVNFSNPFSQMAPTTYYTNEPQPLQPFNALFATQQPHYQPQQPQLQQLQQPLQQPQQPQQMNPWATAPTNTLF